MMNLKRGNSYVFFLLELFNVEKQKNIYWKRRDEYFYNFRLKDFLRTRTGQKSHGGVLNI